MSLSIDSALGLHADALRLRERRMELLANNLANADTPGFKARDMDFAAMLAHQGQALRLASTQTGHIRDLPRNLPTEAELLYRVPTQASLDGNTVDPHLEKAAFAESTVRYEASLMLLGSKVNSLMTAIRGE